MPNKHSYNKLKRLVIHGLSTMTRGKISPQASRYMSIPISLVAKPSGGVAMHGDHAVKHWSKTQTTVCLSSGKAELRGIGDGLAQAIGL